jgi:hypothetical protein
MPLISDLEVIYYLYSSCSITVAVLRCMYSSVSARQIVNMNVSSNCLLVESKM